MANVEPLQSATLTVDSTGPVVSVQMIGGGQYDDPGTERLYASGETQYVLRGDDGFGAGVASIQVDTHAGVGFQTLTGTLTFTEQGRHQLDYFAIDRLGQTGIPGRFIVFVDTQAPSLSAVLSEPVVVASGTNFARSSLRFDFVAGSDDFVGVAGAFVFADASPAASPLQFFTEGPHSVLAYAEDLVGNRTDPPYRLAVTIDDTPPVTRIRADGVAITTGTAISTATALSLAAYDQGIGVAGSSLTVNGTAVPASSIFSLAAGTYTLTFSSVDLLGNRETEQTLSILVTRATGGVPPSPSDTTAPVSVFVAGQPSGFKKALVNITPETPLEIRAVDPPSTGTISGVRETWLSVEGSPFVLTHGSFTLSGVKNEVVLIRFYSVDHALNTEVIRSTAVFVSKKLKNNPRRAGDVAAFGAPGDADFALRGHFVFPNPARGGAQPTLHIEVGQADSLELRIYDVTGRLLKDISLLQAPSMIDSGDGVRLAYEYTWDERFPSAVYFYSFRAKKNGFEDINGKGKFAVVR